MQLIAVMDTLAQVVHLRTVVLLLLLLLIHI